MSAETPALAALLERHRAALLRWVERHARGLLRHEGAEDVVQGVHLRALKQEAQFSYRGDPEFLAWLFLIARQHVADRHDYWSALRRQAGDVLRVTVSGGGGSDSVAPGVNPAGEGIGPGTYAARREMVEIATRALDVMLPRDRDIIKMIGRGRSNAEVAQHLGLSYDAAEQAKRRAIERFRKTVELLSRKGGGSA